MSISSACYCDILIWPWNFFLYLRCFFGSVVVCAGAEAGIFSLDDFDSSISTRTEGCRSAWPVDGSLQLVRCFASVSGIMSGPECTVQRAHTSDVHCLYTYVVEELEQ